ncbi:MAG TPA: hypothetical protein VF194_15935 [Ferrovibrio sp.]|jgi:hypothetical protein|uniref:hypothetical protein n=1 Tax=Ferrovibrio sp. TaxID=1917215 RepID=UPI002ED2574D
MALGVRPRTLITGLAALLLGGSAVPAVPSVAQTVAVAPASLVGRWSEGQAGCGRGEVLEFTAEGGFRSTLDEGDPREGRYRVNRDRIILVDNAEPDHEVMLFVLDLSATNLTAFDESIEADRRLVKCR